MSKPAVQVLAFWAEYRARSQTAPASFDVPVGEAGSATAAVVKSDRFPPSSSSNKGARNEVSNT